MNDLISKCDSKMKKTVDSFIKEISKIRNGSISKSLFDEIRIEYYGSQVPLNQVCNINMNDNSIIVITPYDQTVVDDIIKAIQESALGFNPNNDKNTIIINVPPLTQERRNELVKFLNKETELFRVSIRNIRKEFNDAIKKLQKNKEITTDEGQSGLNKIQDQTDNHIKLINVENVKKEKEIINI